MGLPYDILHKDIEIIFYGLGSSACVVYFPDNSRVMFNTLTDARTAIDEYTHAKEFQEKLDKALQ